MTKETFLKLAKQIGVGMLVMIALSVLLSGVNLYLAIKFPLVITVLKMLLFAGLSYSIGKNLVK
jgi:hypothetical protein